MLRIRSSCDSAGSACELTSHSIRFLFALCLLESLAVPLRIICTHLTETPIWRQQSADYEKRKRAWTKEFAETEYFLANIQRNASRRSKKVEDPLLQRFLKETAEQLEHRKAVLNRFRHGSGHSRLGGLEWFWRRHPSKAALRGIDLDGRLQFQLAKAFRTFLRKERGISTLTIARLIVLVYIVCDLPVVSVRSVYEKLTTRKLPARSVQTDPRTFSFFAHLPPNVQEAWLNDWRHPSGSKRIKLRSSDISEDC
jgi:hypothetical protein